MSIAGGLPKAVERALSVRATALQLFVKSSNQWAARALAPGEADAFRDAVDAAGIGTRVLAHSSYLINIASPDRALWNKSIRALGIELDRCAELGIPSLVLHPGSHVGSGEEEGLRRAAEALDRLFIPSKSDRRVDSRASRGRREVKVLLETTAGQGSNLGSRFEELAWVIGRSKCGERLGVCFDTCHALAAGYEFRDARSYRETFRLFDRVIGIDRLDAFHLNDSKTGIGSRRDRHEHIGHGEVGLEAFRLILNDRRFRALPMVLETPKGEDLAEDRVNLDVLRAMVRS
jgi:deoxyribonuclease-4